MNDESKTIATWTNEEANRRRDSLAAEDVAINERNRLWWEALPMTYEDWDSSNREPSTKEDFERVDRFYFLTNPYILDAVDFESFRGKKVLEIGSGAGSAAVKFALSGAIVSTVDITAKAVGLTQANAVMKGVTIDARQMDAEDLSVMSSDFDFVYSWGVLHHSSNPEKCYSSVFGRLKLGGKGLIMVYHKHSIRYWIKGAYYLWIKGKIWSGDTFETVQRHYTDGFYHKHYTKSSFAAALLSSGLIADKVVVTHMSSKMVPFLPEVIRNYLKSHFGWLLVAHVRKL